MCHISLGLSNRPQPWNTGNSVLPKHFVNVVYYRNIRVKCRRLYASPKGHSPCSPAWQLVQAKPLCCPQQGRHTGIELTFLQEAFLQLKDTTSNKSGSFSMEVIGLILLIILKNGCNLSVLISYYIIGQL